MAAKQRNTRGPATVFTLVMIAIALLMALGHEYWHLAVTDPDRYKLGFERTVRLTKYRAGIDLAGIPDVKTLEARLARAELSLGSPIFVRIFKREFLFEMWIKNGSRFQHFATYPICRFSGRLGPKLKQGDRQAPEGVYTVAASQLNPNSRWHRAFNLGYPNRFDRAHGRTGDFLMVHGGCSSIGCYAMTNATIDEIWKIVTAALDKGQKRFQVQIFPFKMTDQALLARKDHKWAAFWRELKPAYDIFEQTNIPPKVAVCKNTYRFKPAPPATSGSSKIVSSCTGATSG